MVDILNEFLFHVEIYSYYLLISRLPAAALVVFDDIVMMMFSFFISARSFNVTHHTDLRACEHASSGINYDGINKE